MTEPFALPLPPVLDHIAPIAAGRAGVLCDIWGVVHNGVATHPTAIAALSAFRATGGAVVLITNAPRPSSDVRAQLDRLKVPAECYDAIVTSGDVARVIVTERDGGHIYHLGPDKDLGLFEGLNLARVAPSDAHAVLCTGLFDDETETPADYAGLLAELRALGLAMICANPDIQVEKGDRLIYCAGALAEAYRAIGGEVIFTGKPEAPIYRVALAELARITGRPVVPREVLAIGDGMKTDYAGAIAQDLDFVFIASGLSVTAGSDHDARAQIQGLFAGAAKPPIAAQIRLQW